MFSKAFFTLQALFLASLTLLTGMQPVSAGPLKSRVTQSEVPLGKNLIDPQFGLSFNKIQAVGLPDGRVLLGWPDDQGNTHITPLSPALQPQGPERLLKGLLLENFRAHPDGSLLMLASRLENTDYWGSVHTRWPDALYLLNLDPQGQIRFQTRLAGGEGLAPGQHQIDPRDIPALADNGSHYGVYFSVLKNWAEPGEKADIHEGDKFVLLDRQGRILPDKSTFWSISHSDLPQLFVNGRGHFVSLSQGDAHPLGLTLVDRSQNPDRTSLQVIWPGKAQLNQLKKAFPPDGYQSVIGVFGNLLVWQGKLVMTMTTPLPGISSYNDPKDVLLLVMSPQGKILTEKFLTRTPKLGEGRAFVFPLGDHLLVCWPDPQHQDQTIMEEIDVEGNVLQGPESLPVPFASNQMATHLANGDLLWTWIPPLADKVQSITLVRIAAQSN